MSVRKPISEALVRLYEPRQSWLLHDSYYHGVDHMARVFILQELICDELEAKKIAVNREAVRLASFVHDVGREDDGTDSEHGIRSAKWMEGYFSHTVPQETLDIASYIVHWHVPPDDEAPAMTTELQVLKDADGLDRVRLGNLDARYLRTKAATQLVTVAEDLFQAYEATEAQNPFEAVIKAGRSTGLIVPDTDETQA